MRTIYLFIAISALIACTNSERGHKYTVTKYKKIEDGYQYSKDVFTYQNNIYRPLMSLDYSHDTLVSIDVYKSEGKVRYNKQELNDDTLFMRFLNIFSHQKLEIIGNIVIDNERKYRIEYQRHDSIIFKKYDTLFLITHLNKKNVQ